MPYRLMNHLTTLLIPISIATLALARNRDKWNEYLLSAAVAAGTLLFLFRGPIRDAWVMLGSMLQLEFSDGILFGLYGAALAVTTVRFLDFRRLRVLWLSVLGTTVLLLALTHHACLVRSVGEPFAAARAESYPVLFAVFCLVAGFVLSLALEGRTSRSAAAPGVLAVSCVVLACVMLYQEGIRRSHLPVTPFERSVREYLGERGEEQAMILPPFQQQGLQARLHHPVMVDMGLFGWPPYRISMGPPLYKLYKDLYGINLAPEEGERPYPGPHWEGFPERHVWPQRSLTEWQRLGEEYDFRYVLAPDFVALQLREVLRGDGNVLYVIPQSGPQND
jgi:hypothetical protein